MAKLPLVSICIPAYNSEAFVGEAILSAVRQNYKNIEIIIVDNCSTDSTRRIIEKLAKKNNKIKSYVNRQHVCMYDNFNRTLDYAKGDYIKFLCADDLLHETCVEKFAGVMERHKDVGIVTCRDLTVDENGRKIASYHPMKKSGPMKGTKVIRKMYRRALGDCCNSPTHIMFRRQGNCKFSNFHQDGWGNDTLKWMEILSSSNYYFIDEELICNRVHPTAASTDIKKQKRQFQEYYDYFQFFRRKSGLYFSPIDDLIFSLNFLERLDAESFDIDEIADGYGIFGQAVLQLHTFISIIPKRKK